MEIQSNQYGHVIEDVFYPKLNVTLEKQAEIQTKMSIHFGALIKNKTNFELKIKIGMINDNKKMNQKLIEKTMSRNNTIGAF